ncbi:hypothetical protein Ga0074812_111111 [Parafrankia irregularis]|uniref:TrbL/VirB6 plasmid conjugal transfer protein n=2 Tax=Parafrankia TaxID=2994362 RepID=A0A0S4QNL3_9ACTN|nr:hypothetical protein [Parafrankia irregularis]CUU57275.1 hypothetical protein Ga0074812_111111 [Parafrankia irregularis]
MTTAPAKEVLAVPNPLSGIGDAISGIAGGAADDFLDSVGKAFCNMAADLSSSVFSFAAQKTAVDLNAQYVVDNYNIVFGVSVLIVTGLFLCSCTVAALRGDPHVFVRALATTGTAIIGSFIALTLLQMVLAASDGMAEAFGNDKALGADLVAQLRELPEQGNFALDLVLSLLVAIFAFTLFVVLYIRKVAIIVVAVFIPLYLAGQPTMTTSAWMKRATETLVALIFAKPVIYAIFALGAGIAQDTGGSTVDQTLSILSGVVVMIAAVLSPFMLMHLLGFADVQLMRAVGSAGQRSAASFGHGAGALLGSTSRETFRGIGSRLQTRNRGMLGDAGAFGGSTVPAARPAVRPGRGGSGSPAPVGTPARAGAAGTVRARVNRSEGSGVGVGAAPAGTRSGRNTVGATAATRAVPARAGAPSGGGGRAAAAAPPRTPVARTAAPAAHVSGSTVARPPVTPQAAPRVTPPARTGGGE